ncbi:MAG: hypothetical protein NVSMB17_01960 [Candidatus Dormibacteria bacterium]
MAEAAQARRRSWWSRFVADLALRIEHRGAVLWYLIVERGIKGVVLVLVGLYVLAHVRSGLDGFARGLIEQLNLDSGSSFLKHWAYHLVLKFIGVSRSSLLALSIGSILYGVIEGAESVGLVLRRRWAEYLVVLATAFFIPLEALELAHRFTPVRAVTLLLNVVVVIYLVRKKRLFYLDEPEAER